MLQKCLSSSSCQHHYGASFSLLDPRVHRVCHQEPTSTLPFDKHNSAPYSARAEIQDGLCARRQNQAQFYYGNHTNCNSNSQTAVTPKPKPGPPHSTIMETNTNPPSPKQVTSSLWVSCISWQTSCPLGTSGNLLRNLIYRSQSFQLSENTQKRGQCAGCREPSGSWDSFSPAPSSPGLSSSLHLGKNTALGYFHCVHNHTQHTKPVAFRQRNRAWEGTSQSKSEVTEIIKSGEKQGGGKDVCHLKVLAPWEGWAKKHILCSESKHPQAGQLQGPGNSTAASHSGASSVCLTARRQPAAASRHVVVLIWTIFVSFHIVSVYKWLNPFFQVSRLEKRNQTF